MIAARQKILISQAVIAGSFILSACTQQAVQPRTSNGLILAQEAACRTLQLASSRGPMPIDPDVIVIRWLGAANHEITYRDQVFLLDAYYSRVPPAAPLDFTLEEVEIADAIFVGHGHADHISDAVSVARRTGARVYGGPPSYEFLKQEGLPESQAIEVKGGEIVEFEGVTIQAVLAHHAVRNVDGIQAAGEAWRNMRSALVRERTPEEEILLDNIERGSRDPRIADEGTIGYLFTFEHGFTLFYQDTAGPVTEAQRVLMESLGSVDMALLAYVGFYLTGPQIEATMPLVRQFKPRIFMPTHHDNTGGRFPEVATYPLFMRIRDEFPSTQSISPMYRSPVCIDALTKDIFVGRGSGEHDGWGLISDAVVVSPGLSPRELELADERQQNYGAREEMAVRNRADETLSALEQLLQNTEETLQPAAQNEAFYLELEALIIEMEMAIDGNNLGRMNRALDRYELLNQDF